MADTAVVWQARVLLRGARAGTLCTARDGQPFGALVTPACAPDLSVLMLLSSLSEHTRHLRHDPRCALAVVGAATGLNPQTAPRLTVVGEAAVEPDPALKARWIARHPYAAFYADFTDFALFRLRPTGGHYIGGFASAHRLSHTDLTLDEAAVAAIAAAEAGIMAHMNTDHAAAIAHMAGGAGWQMVAVDVDGCDLARDEDVKRIDWAGPVTDAGGVRAELVRLARQAPENGLGHAANPSSS
jgi:putative heme iron utilization protein